MGAPRWQWCGEKDMDRDKDRDKNKDRGKDRVKDSVSSLPRCRNFPLFAPELYKCPLWRSLPSPVSTSRHFLHTAPLPPSLLHPPSSIPLRLPHRRGFALKRPKKEKGRAAERGAGLKGAGGALWAADAAPQG